MTKGERVHSGFSVLRHSITRKRGKPSVDSTRAESFSTCSIILFLFGLSMILFIISSFMAPPTTESNKGDMACRAEYPALQVRVTKMTY